MNIDIDDGLYERISKVAQARPLPTSPEREIEKAVALHLATWEKFFFGGIPTDGYSPVPLWEGGPCY